MYSAEDEGRVSSPLFSIFWYQGHFCDLFCILGRRTSMLVFDEFLALGRFPSLLG